MEPNRPKNDGDEDDTADYTRHFTREGTPAPEEYSPERTGRTEYVPGTDILLRWAATLPPVEFESTRNISGYRDTAFGRRENGPGYDPLEATLPKYEALARATQEESRASVVGDGATNSNNREYYHTTGSFRQIQQAYGNRVRPTVEEYRAARSRTFGDHPTTPASREHDQASGDIQTIRQQYGTPARAAQEESGAASSMSENSTTPFTYNYASVYSHHTQELYGTPARTTGGKSKTAGNIPGGSPATSRSPKYGQTIQRRNSDPASTSGRKSMTARVIPRDHPTTPDNREHDLGAKPFGQSRTSFRAPERTAQKGWFNPFSPAARRSSEQLSPGSEQAVHDPSAIISSIGTRSMMPPPPRPTSRTAGRSAEQQSRGRRLATQDPNAIVELIGTQRLMPPRDPMAAFYAPLGPQRVNAYPQSSIGRHAPPDEEAAERAKGRVKRAESRPKVSQETVAAQRDVVPQYESVLTEWETRDAILKEMRRRRKLSRQGLMAPPPPPSPWTPGSKTRKEKGKKENERKKRELRRKARKDGKRLKRETLVRKLPRSAYPGRQSEFVTRALEKSFEDHVKLSGRLYENSADESSAGGSSSDESSGYEGSAYASSADDNSWTEVQPRRRRAPLSTRNTGANHRSIGMSSPSTGPRRRCMDFPSGADQRSLQEQRVDNRNSSLQSSSERHQSSTLNGNQTERLTGTYVA